MNRQVLTLCTSLTLLLACGGGSPSRSGGSGTAPTLRPMSADTAESMLTAFLLAEHGYATVPGLPSQTPGGAPGVMGLSFPAALPPCVGVAMTGTASVTLTFTNCTGPHGGTLNGQLALSWAPGQVTVAYQHLQAAKGTQSWTLDGTKSLKVDAAAKTATVTATGITFAFADSAAPATNATLSYGCNLASTWATAGTYAVTGTFTVQRGNEAALTGTLPASAPLTWTAGCCHPSSGSLGLQQGSAHADLAFGPPCGTLTITPFGQPAVTRLLAPCP